MSASKRFQANKRFGQHFLVNESIVRRMADLAQIECDTHVLEVGPGPGILTRALLGTSLKKLTCIEIDTQFIDSLHKLSNDDPRLSVLSTDALKVPLNKIGSVSIIANLPYNVGNQLIINWLYEINYVHRILVMLQKEVVDRIVAVPGTKAYGRLSVLCQALCDTKKEFIVKPGNFSPPPKVDSAVVHLIPKTMVESIPIDTLSHLTNVLFQNRRKMVHKALQGIHPKFAADCEDMGIKPTMRAENITVDQYVKMAGLFKEKYNR